MDDDDWGLHAVVRSCARASSHAAAGDPPPPLLHGDPQPFFPGPERRGLPPPLVGRLLLPKQRPLPGAGARSKRRKSQVKKVVCQVPADGVCADVWAWRKYGQKPIKGSPFPRGYYRCSSSKGCPARKLVERSRADPSSFIVTYTAEHNHAAPAHRSCLAGSTRAKSTPAAPPQNGGNCSSDAGPAAGGGLSPTTPLPAPADDAEALLMRLEDDEDDDAFIDFGCYSC